MLASRILREHDGEVGVPEESAAAPARRVSASRVERLYHRLLDKALARRWSWSRRRSSSPASAAVIYTQLPEQLTPNEDRGFIPISVSAPQGVTVDFMDAQMRQVEAAVEPFVRERRGHQRVPDRRPAAGGNSGFVVLTLAPWDERTRSAQEIVQRAQSAAAEDPRRADLDAPGEQPRHPRRRPGPAIRHHRHRLRHARRQGGRAAQALEDAPAFDTVRLNYDTTQPELSVADRPRRRPPISACRSSTLGTTLATLLDGQEIGKYYVDGDAIPVRAQAPDGMIDDPSDLENIFVRTAAGRMVPLSSFVTVTERAVAPELPREGQRRAVPISGDACARHRPSPGDGHARGRSRRAARSRHGHPLSRRGGGAERDVERRRHHLRLRAARRAAGARGAVRELRQRHHHHVHGAVRARRGGLRDRAHRRLAQHLQPDRPRDAGRHHVEERHPDRGVRQPAPRAGLPRATTRSARPAASACARW